MFAIWLAVGFQPGDGKAETVALVTGNEYPPFTDESLPHGGLATRLVRLIYQEMGVQPVFSFRPWKRGYTETLDGKYAATFPYIYTDERAQLFEYSEPLFFVVAQIYVLRDTGPEIRKPEDMEGMKTCLPTGYANSAAIEKEVTAGRVARETASSMAVCFRLLARDRIDFVEANNFLGPVSIRKSGEDLDLFQQAEMASEGIGQYLIFPKANPKSLDLIRKFNDQLKKFQSGRRLDQIVEQYLSENHDKL